MKTITKNCCDFSEIFYYAEEKFGVHWNACCDIFHASEILPYRNRADFNFLEVIGSIERFSASENFEDDFTIRRMLTSFKAIPIEDIKAMDNTPQKAWYILTWFMIDNEIESMEVDSN